MALLKICRSAIPLLQKICNAGNEERRISKYRQGFASSVRSSASRLQYNKPCGFLLIGITAAIPMRSREKS